MTEIWKAIDDRYSVSNLGRVKSNYASKERILKPFANKHGYLIVDIRHPNFRKSMQIHRLVAMAFIPNPDNLPQINHKNEDKSDNRVENLRWASASENGNNTKLNRSIYYNGETKTLTEWSRILGIKQVTLYQRVFISKWNVEKAFTQPVMVKKRGNKNVASG